MNIKLNAIPMSKALLKNNIIIKLGIGIVSPFYFVIAPNAFWKRALHM